MSAILKDRISTNEREADMECPAVGSGAGEMESSRSIIESYLLETEFTCQQWESVKKLLGIILNDCLD